MLIIYISIVIAFTIFSSVIDVITEAILYFTMSDCAQKYTL